MATYSSRDVLEATKVLVSPVQQKSETTNNAGEGLSVLFQMNLKALQNKLQQDEYTELQRCLPAYKEVQRSSEWCALYLETCLELLLCLKQSLINIGQEKKDETKDNFKKKRPHDYAPPLPPATLSISDQRTVTALTQFIVCLGVSPNLESGVGIPLSMRSEFSCLLQETSNLSELAKKQKLIRVMKILLDSTEVTTLGGVILSKYLNDFLAALLQLSFKPRRKTTVLSGEIQATLTNPQEKESGKHPSGRGVPNREFNQISSSKSLDQQTNLADAPDGHLLDSTEAPDDRHIWRKELEMLLNKLYQPMVIRELLVLQGGPSKGRSRVTNPLPPAPVWLRKACGRLLSERLMKDNGVHNVLSGILDSTGGDAASNWKQCEMIAKLLVNCPKQIQIDVYYQNICPQVLELIKCQDVLVMKKYLRIACCFINDVITRHYELALELLIKPLQQPLLKCIETDGRFPSSPESIIIPEDAISSCVDSLLKVYVIGGSQPSQQLLQSLHPIIHPLFKLCVFSKNGITHLKSHVEDILHQFFKMSDTAMSVRILQHLTLLRHDPLLGVMSPHLTFSPGSGGGAIVTIAEDNSSSDTASVDILGDQDVAATVLFEILGKSKMNKLMGDFFIAVLNELTNIMTTGSTADSININDSPSGSKVLLQLEMNHSNKLHSIQHALVVLNLVAKMCEEMGPNVLENKVQMIAFVEATLHRACNRVSGEGEDAACQADSTLFEDETLSMALGLLSLIAAEIKQVDSELKNKLTSLIPPLTIIGNKHSNKHLKQMASSIQASIATHGATKVDPPDNVSQRLKSLAQENKERLSETNNTPSSSKDYQVDGVASSSDVDGSQKVPTPDNVSQNVKENKESVANSEPRSHPCKDHQEGEKRGSYITAGNNLSSKIKSEERRETESDDVEVVSESFDEAYRDLFDPLLPVRGHALIALGKLLRAKDPKAMQKKDILYRTFKEKLTDDDTYIYLAAIQGLEAMADVYPDQVIPALCTEYVNWEKTKEGVSDNEVRMKIGESLVKATRNLGELVPYHKQDLLAAVLTVTKDPDADVRASSLANLAEICKLLKFSLGSVIHEVMNCLVSILQTDSEIIVKRACVNVVTLMLRGLGREATTILESSLLSLYRTLKLILRTENDDVMKLHAELALKEMDLFMRDYLFPQQTLSKKIVVLP